MKFESTAIIIAGGKSSRMQRDKALLPFGKFNSLAEFQCVRLEEMFENVYLSAKGNKFDFDIRLIVDKYEDASPLVALVSVFKSLTLDEVFVLSVDAPFVGREVIEKLYEASTAHADIIVAKSSRGLEPLCAIYRRSFLEKAEEALSQNRHRLQTLFDQLNVIEVSIEEDEMFLNLNYPEEYADAKRKIDL